MNPIGRRAALAEAVGEAYVDACLLDITALKPGNVGVHAEGHGMQALDFIRSTEATAAVLVDSAGSLGERIQRAVAATQQTVNSNTNLGIVLLVAPLAHAASHEPLFWDKERLTHRLRAVLAALTVADAEHTFDAIRRARPSGLGTAARHDVHGPARVGLAEAMCEAAERDMIARQYANGYADVIETGLTRIAGARARRRDWRWTATEVYLAFLASYPDSHIARKYGAAEAASIRDAAAEFDRAALVAQDLSALAQTLLRWDEELKARRINPGTSADLTVASLFFWFLCEPKVEGYPHRGARCGAGAEVGTIPTG